MESRLLTPEQVADRLQISEHTVYLWLRSGMLPGMKLGRLWRIRGEDLEEFVMARTRQNATGHVIGGGA